MEPHQVAAQSFVGRIESVILFPLIALLTGVALLLFLWGIFQYVSNAENPEARAKGTRHMIFGIIGLVIMVSAYGILKIVTATFGI
ncbi:MAG: hypothetical protein LR017_03640 [Candidatus Pacebacteria bacterium]|nr:hypothetical protein [Candidatus Paceibacterota bacterium]